MRWIAIGVGLVLGVAAAHGGTYDRLGAYEREAVDEVLAKHVLAIDPSPGDKRIGSIQIVNLEVFSEKDGFLEWFNIFHRTTRDEIIRRELLFRTGAMWNQELIDETLRNIRDPFLSNVVVILPVKSTTAGVVDVLVVTRDVWSLRLNSNFQIHDGVLRLLNLSIAENNLFGWRKTASMRFNMDQGIFWIGPHYSDPNIAGTRLKLYSDFSTIFNRETQAYEGTSSNVHLTYPLWSLASVWAGSAKFSHTDYISRRYVGSDAVLEYENRGFNVVTRGLASIGRSVKHQFSLTHRLIDFESALVHSADPTVWNAPNSRRESELIVGYRLYTPQWMETRDVDTFDFREDYRVGPDVSVSIARAFEFLGSNEEYTGLSAAASWMFALPKEAFIRLKGSWYGRLQDGALFDHSLGGSFYGVSPRLGRYARLITRFKVGVRLENGSGNLGYQLGGENGMRGYSIGAFEGESYLLGQLEMRTMPLHMGFVRLGGVVFWDMGHAAAKFSELDPHHDVGVGFRLLIPQANPYVLRADWAFGLQGNEAGWPGRFSFGFQQVF
jgi:outer membrane protein assembly factor BamA